MINIAALKFHTVARKTQSIPLASLLLVAVVVLFIAYLMQANAVATSVYRLDAVEEERSSSVTRLERLDLELTELQSASGLAGIAAELGLKQPETIHYLSPSAMDVAVVMPE